MDGAAGTDAAVTAAAGEVAPEVAPNRPRFIGSEIYRANPFGPVHPLAIPRVSTVMDLCRALGWLGPGAWLSSPRARPAALAAFHTPGYLAALVTAEAEGRVDPGIRARHGLGTPSNPVHPLMFRRPATGAGGALLAADLLTRPGAGGVVHVPGAGTHHAMADRAAGFCYLNDPVLALLHLQRRGLRRVACIDIDAHHGDGVEAALAGHPGVLLISVHEELRWPFTGRLTDTGGGNALNLPVPAGFNDTEMAHVRDRLILPALEVFRPDAVVLICGADMLEEDPLSRLSLSNNAPVAVLRAVRGLTPRLIVTGGGGYNPWSVARLWSRVWAEVSGADLPDRLPPEGRAVLEALRWPQRVAGRNPPSAWRETLIDPPRPGPLRPGVVARVEHLRARLPGLGA